MAATQNGAFVCLTEDMMMDDEYDDCCDYDDGPIVTRVRRREPMPTDGPIVDKTSPALRKAIQDELKEMVDENLTHSMLNQVSRFANIAQELIMVRSPIADVRQRKRRRGPLAGNFNYAGGVSVNPVIGGTGYPLEENALTGEAEQNETFGATITRELVSAMSKLGESQATAKDKDPIEDLVKAVSTAKKSGLDDLAEKLEAKLHEVLSKQFLDAAAKEIEDEKDGPVPRERSLVGPVKPINGTPVAP